MADFLRGFLMIARALTILAGLLLATGALAGSAGQTAHDFSFTAIDGGPLSLSEFAGQPVRVVKTASRCGFTRQYGELQDVWERYRDRGLVVLGVPSNDFGGQEPGTEAEIKEFCEVNFSVDFPMTAKVAVRGAEAHPFYAWAASELGEATVPRWNFHKYLLGRDGRLVDWFSTPTPPDAPPVLAAIESALESPGAGDLIER